jgi:hypothetical protein
MHDTLASGMENVDGRDTVEVSCTLIHHRCDAEKRRKYQCLLSRPSPFSPVRICWTLPRTWILTGTTREKERESGGEEVGVHVTGFSAFAVLFRPSLPRHTFNGTDPTPTVKRSCK